MKKKSNDMSFDMFNDATTSSTPIPVFTTANEVDNNELQNPLQTVTDDFTGVGKPTPIKCESQNPLQTVTEDFTGVKKFTPVNFQDEIIKVNFDKQTVSARALYDFFAPTERFHFWCKRMFAYGLIENVDFTGVNFFTAVNQGAKQDIGDYLLTVDAAKHIAMVQRSEKGKQARNYFINVEKLYLKTISNKQTDVRSASLVEKFDSIVAQFDNLRNSIALLENVNSQQQQLQKNYDSLVEKTMFLEKQLVEQADLFILKEKYIERAISKKVDIAMKDTFSEANRIMKTENSPHIDKLNVPTYKMLDMKSNYRNTASEEELIKQYYLPAHRKVENAVFLTGTEITVHLEKFNIRVTVNSVGMALKKLGFERVPHSTKGGRVKGYFVIQLFDSI